MRIAWRDNARGENSLRALNILTWQVYEITTLPLVGEFFDWPEP